MCFFPSLVGLPVSQLRGRVPRGHFSTLCELAFGEGKHTVALGGVLGKRGWSWSHSQRLIWGFYLQHGWFGVATRSNQTCDGPKQAPS